MSDPSRVPSQKGSYPDNIFWGNPDIADADDYRSDMGQSGIHLPAGPERLEHSIGCFGQIFRQQNPQFGHKYGGMFMVDRSELWDVCAGNWRCHRRPRNLGNWLHRRPSAVNMSSKQDTSMTSIASAGRIVPERLQMPWHSRTPLTDCMVIKVSRVNSQNICGPRLPEGDRITLNGIPRWTGAEHALRTSFKSFEQVFQFWETNTH